MGFTNKMAPSVFEAILSSAHESENFPSRQVFEEKSKDQLLIYVLDSCSAHEIPSEKPRAILFAQKSRNLLGYVIHVCKAKANIAN